MSAIALHTQNEEGGELDDAIAAVLARFGHFRRFLADISCYELDIWNAMFCADSYTDTHPVRITSKS